MPGVSELLTNAKGSGLGGGWGQEPWSIKEVNYTGHRVQLFLCVVTTAFVHVSLRIAMVFSLLAKGLTGDAFLRISSSLG